MYDIKKSTVVLEPLLDNQVCCLHVLIIIGVNFKFNFICKIIFSLLIFFKTVFLLFRPILARFFKPSRSLTN